MNQLNFLISGGAKGLAHIGILKAIDSAGLILTISREPAWALLSDVYTQPAIQHIPLK
jgi:hypothetical protein